VAPGRLQTARGRSIREVYGMRQIIMDERAHVLQVEYDASRLTKDDVIALFRDAGIELWRLPLAA